MGIIIETCNKQQRNMNENGSIVMEISNVQNPIGKSTLQGCLNGTI